MSIDTCDRNVSDDPGGASNVIVDSCYPEALLRTTELRKALLNRANFLSIVTDQIGVIRIFNVGAERMLGYAAVDVVNAVTVVDICDPLETSPIVPGFSALVANAALGGEDVYELTYIRKDGGRVPIVVSVTALRSDQDAVIGYLWIGVDNSARKWAEAEQKSLNQRLRDHQFYTRSLIESNIDALMTIDTAGIITDVNRQTEALTGCTRDELIGAPFKNCFTDPERAEAGIKLALREEKVTNYHLVARDRDGRTRTVSYSATTFYDRNRKLQGVFAAARDVTDDRDAQPTVREQTPNYRL
ncbi:MAG: sensor hybrid histidine kinase [Acidobacteria bacterium]|nr:sensor hybrid histidine kinase [Acidobacteriota bacterium]